MTTRRPPASPAQRARAKPHPFSAADAVDLVRERGAILVSAKGARGNVVDAIAGAPVKGSWWGHPDGKRIFAVLNAVSASDDVLVCRLIDGKITFVHRRLWPALARLASLFPPERIARVREEHTASGRHASRSVAFADWVSPAVIDAASELAEPEARALLAEWLPPDDANDRG